MSVQSVRTKKSKTKTKCKFGEALSIEQLKGLAAEMQDARDHRPLVKRKDGKYEGDILGFVKGLRLSARLIYFLRENLSSTGLQTSWGHLLIKNQSCSPECDVIVHTRGHVRKWNGCERPIMEFKFIDSDNARAVVSCKSRLTTIDKTYPKALKKFGIKYVFLFAECCIKTQYPALQKRAINAGYRGLWCLYFVDSKGGYLGTDEVMYVDFRNKILKAVNQ